jgi:hypothetical protein
MSAIRRGSFAPLAVLAGLLTFGTGLLGQAQEPTGGARGEAPAPVEPAPTWRFKLADRPVKVVVLAGSIGAWPKQPYAERIAKMCKHVEVKNLSKVGFGAFALRQRFKAAGARALAAAEGGRQRVLAGVPGRAQ